MGSNTTNHNYYKPTDGETSWGDEKRSDWDDVDVDMEIRDRDSNKSNYAALDGALFRATDTKVLYEGSGSNWVLYHDHAPFERSGGQPVTTATTARLVDGILADASSGTFDITLPAPSTDMEVTVKKVDSSSNAVGVATPNAETIDGQSRLDMTKQYASRTIVSDGTNYYII